MFVVVTERQHPTVERFCVLQVPGGHGVRTNLLAACSLPAICSTNLVLALFNSGDQISLYALLIGLVARALRVNVVIRLLDALSCCAVSAIMAVSGKDADQALGTAEGLGRCRVPLSFRRRSWRAFRIDAYSIVSLTILDCLRKPLDACCSVKDRPR